MKKKFLATLGAGLSTSMLSFTTSAFAAVSKTDVYKNSTGIDSVDKAGKTILGVVGGVGMTAFVLAFLVIALCLGFMSLSPQNASRMWKALMVCAAAALIFFSAYMFPDQISKLVG